MFGHLDSTPASMRPFTIHFRPDAVPQRLPPRHLSPQKAEFVMNDLAGRFTTASRRQCEKERE